jgi:mono/diheme cytochrome c family protein
LSWILWILPLLLLGSLLVTSLWYFPTSSVITNTDGNATKVNPNKNTNANVAIVLPSANTGKLLFKDKFGCITCHETRKGPSLLGLFGSKQQLTNGNLVIVDETYISNSILTPFSEVVEGYQPIMPTFKGQITDEELADLVEYIKSLSSKKQY